jgi:acetyl-CoA carboxylase biotin carboxyl carrier protein
LALTDEDVSEILRIIDESQLDELTIETPSFSLHVHRGSDAPAAPADPIPAPAAPADPIAAPATPAAPADPIAAPATPAAPADPISAPATPAAPADPAPPPPSPSAATAEIEAPMLGTFYRTESPTHPPFVAVGDRVEAGTVVCLIEVMKLMNHIQSGVAGTIVEVLAQSGELVEFGQPLFRVARERE